MYLNIEACLWSDVLVCQSLHLDALADSRLAHGGVNAVEPENLPRNGLQTSLRPVTILNVNPFNCEAQVVLFSFLQGSVNAVEPDNLLSDGGSATGESGRHRACLC